MVISDILKRSYYMVSEYYRNHLEPFFENIDENILWIGPAEKHLLRSKEAILEAWSKESHTLTFSMGNVTEYSVPLTSKCCNVILTFPVYTHYPDGVTQMHSQRMDFTWLERKIKDENGSAVTVPRVVKLHISNGAPLDKRDFIYAVHSEYVNGFQSFISPGKRVLFGGRDGLIRSYLAESILWIEKLDHGKYTVVHTATENVDSNKNTDYFTENYPDLFLSPHRSYLVNPIHIRNVCRFKLTLDNGDTLPIPEKKYTRFKEALAKWTSDWNQQQGAETGINS